MAFLENIARRAAPQFFTTLERRVQVAESNLALLEESFGSMENLAREDAEFVRIGLDYQQIFSRSFLNSLIQMSRWYFLRNPIIRRGTRIQSLYAFGRGVEIRMEDEKANATLQEFVKLNRKILGITGLADAEDKAQTDGNLFIACFKEKAAGRVRLRIIDTLEVERIITDPEDADTPWYYKRNWNRRTINPDGVIEGEQVSAWYPDIDYNPDPGSRPMKFGNVEIMWDSPVLHSKMNAPNGNLFGLPDAWAAFDWAKAYKLFLQAWCQKEQTLARFALEITTKGGQKAVTAIQDSIQSTLSTGARETNPAPVAGSAWIAGSDSKFNAIKTAGSNTSPDEARRVFLMAVAGFAPETFFGDASVGSLATAQSLDRPTELKFLFAQERWKEIIKRLGSFAVKASKAAPGGSLRQVNGDTDQEADVLVSFPPILEHDISTMVTAMVSAFTLDGKAAAGIADQKTMGAMFLHVLGIKSPEKILDEMYPPGKYNPIDWAAATPEERASQAADMAKRAADVANAQNQNNPTESMGAAVLAASLQKLVEALPKK